MAETKQYPKEVVQAMENIKKLTGCEVEIITDPKRYLAVAGAGLGDHELETTEFLDPDPKAWLCAFKVGNAVYAARDVNSRFFIPCENHIASRDAQNNSKVLGTRQVNFLIKTKDGKTGVASYNAGTLVNQEAVIAELRKLEVLFADKLQPAIQRIERPGTQRRRGNGTF